MKILTATSQGQGARDNDFDWTVEGELVWVGFTCDDDLLDPEGGCGCGRAFSGLSSLKATTTAMVRDLPMTRDDVIRAHADYLKLAGYGEMFAEEDLAEEVDFVLQGVSAWATNAIVRRRLDLVGPGL